jgi:hypothetical protein
MGVLINIILKAKKEIIFLKYLEKKAKLQRVLIILIILEKINSKWV